MLIIKLYFCLVEPTHAFDKSAQRRSIRRLHKAVKDGDETRVKEIFLSEPTIDVNFYYGGLFVFFLACK